MDQQSFIQGKVLVSGTESDLERFHEWLTETIAIDGEIRRFELLQMLPIEKKTFPVRHPESASYNHPKSYPIVWQKAKDGSFSRYQQSRNLLNPVVLHNITKRIINKQELVVTNEENPRIFWRYHFQTFASPLATLENLADKPIWAVINELDQWVKIAQSDEPHRFPSIEVDTGLPTSEGQAPDPDSHPNPVREDPKPEEILPRGLYVSQYSNIGYERLARFGLTLRKDDDVEALVNQAETLVNQAQEIQKTSKNRALPDIGLAQEFNENADQLPYGRSIYEENRTIRGEGAVIFVLDNIPMQDDDVTPRVGVGTPVDGSSVDVIIDLHPTNYNRPNLPRLARPERSSFYTNALRHHGLMCANLCKLIAPGAKIVLVRALKEGMGDPYQITQFLFNLLENYQNYPWLNGMNKFVFNLSLVIAGTTREDLDTPSLYETLNYLCTRRFRQNPKPEFVFVCAAGNGSKLGEPRSPMEPAAYGYFPGYDHMFAASHRGSKAHVEASLEKTPFNLVIGVAASSLNYPGLFAPYSNRSPFAAPVDDILLDPGEDIDTGLEATPTTRYLRWSGTSFSAPIVSAQAALLLSRGIPAVKVKKHIWRTATTREGDDLNRIGEINIRRSLGYPD